MTTPRRLCFGVASSPLTESTREKKQACVSISRFQSESQRSAARRALAALGSTAGWKTLMPEDWSFLKSSRGERGRDRGTTARACSSRA